MSQTGHNIGLATPFSWTSASHVNHHVAQLAAQLTARGHRVTIIAPSADRAAVRRARERVREVLMDERESLFDPGEAHPRFFFAGGTYPVRLNRHTTLIAASAELMSDIDVLLQSEQLDVLHVHEPFVPGFGWTSLRHAGCPLVGTFHADSEAYRAYWAAWPRLQRYFNLFDANIAVSRAVRDSAARAFEGEFRIVPDGVDLELFRPAPQRRPGPVRVLFEGGRARRSGLRSLLRALSRLTAEPDELELHVCGDDLQALRYEELVPAAFADKVVFHGRLPEEELAALYADADVLCAAAYETESFAASVVRGMASGAAVLASDIPAHRDLIADGREGVLVPPRQPRALARELRSLISDQERRAALAAGGLKAAQRFGWEHVVAELEQTYDEVLRRRQRRVSRRGPVELYADLHVHSEHSKDCAVPVRGILARARELGINIVAITDHNNIDGGLEGVALAEEYGLRVIPGEEVKTAEGEVIGLFLSHAVPSGLSFAATITAIKAQGGVVYVPHPFDRLHTVPSYALLRQHAAEIDVMEVFNARLAFPSFNERAELFAQRYRIPAAAGSDAHVLPGLGTALTGMAGFEGRDDFVAALAECRIVRRRKSFLYLTARKFVQTNLTGQLPR
jgi:glycosyltransferase involved in cell wall biosynthesis/predicted metal-dependent phosphoesterase TrpH